MLNTYLNKLSTQQQKYSILVVNTLLLVIKIRINIQNID